MKKWAFLLLLAWACGPAKITPASAVLTTGCPKQARCTIELLRDQRMEISDNNGVHFTLAPSAGTHVVKYKYDKIVKGDLQDTGYREEIIFEWDGTRPLTLKDAQLQNAKMLFGRFCYCKGQTGYYPVREGMLSIGSDGRATLDFTVTQVPQIVHSIAFELQ